MANTTTTASNGFSWGSLAVPFVAVGRFLVMIAETSPRVRELERLNLRSDAQLAARGLTRDGEIRRILGVSASI